MKLKEPSRLALINVVERPVNMKLKLCYESPSISIFGHKHSLVMIISLSLIALPNKNLILLGYDRG